MKICIIGYSGAGKSTLARALSQKLNIPCLHLDSVYWYGDWQNRSREEVNQIVAQFAAENSNYIIEGNYRYAYPHWFEECDVLVFLAFNRFVCFRRAFSRYKKFKGRQQKRRKLGSCICNVARHSHGRLHSRRHIVRVKGNA